MVRVEDLNITFFHAAKNAGSAIEKWLKNNSNCEVYNNDIRHGNPIRLKPLFDDYGWSFCVIRNPWDRVVSWYRFFVKQKKVTCSFGSYIEEAYRRGYDRSTRKYMIPISSQLPFSRNVSYVMRYENITEDFKEVQKRFNCFKPLTKFNVSNIQNKNYVDYFNNTKHIKLVQKWHEEEIEEYNYTFGG